MRSILLSLVLLALPASSIAEPVTGGAIEGFARQRAAWNAGDLEGALATYLDDPAMTWVSAKGVEHGRQAFAEAMRLDYAGKPDAMGTYSGEVLDARNFDATRSLLVVRWSITRHGRRIMGGVSTQLWEQRGIDWVIVLEHAS